MPARSTSTLAPEGNLEDRFVVFEVHLRVRPQAVVDHVPGLVIEDHNIGFFRASDVLRCFLEDLLLRRMIGHHPAQCAI
jgi:hypothetical protein